MEEGKKFKEVTDYLNMLNMMYYVEVGLPLVLFLAIYLNNKELLSANGFLGFQQVVIKSVICLGVIASILIGESIFKRRLKVDFSQSFLESKLHSYFQASIIRYSAYFIGALMAISGMFYFMEGAFVGMYMVALFAVSMIRPTKKRIIATKIFTEEEVEVINNEDSIP